MCRLELVGSPAERGREPAPETPSCELVADRIRSAVPCKSDFGVAVLLLKALDPFDVPLNRHAAVVSCVKAVWQHGVSLRSMADVDVGQA
jgi:hypothetical protein